MTFGGTSLKARQTMLENTMMYYFSVATLITVYLVYVTRNDRELHQAMRGYFAFSVMGLFLTWTLQTS